MIVECGVSSQLAGEASMLLLALQPSLDLCCRIWSLPALGHVHATNFRLLCNGSFRILLQRELPFGHGLFPAFGLFEI